MLSAREVAKKKMLAKAYEGISYVATIDKYEVKVKVGKDIYGKYLYFQPVVRYNNIVDAINKAEEYRELINSGMGRARKVTIINALDNRIELEEKAIKEGKDSRSRLVGLKTARKCFSKYELANKKNIKDIAVGEMIEIIEDMRQTLAANSIDCYIEALKNSVKKFVTNNSEADIKRLEHLLYLFRCCDDNMRKFRKEDKDKDKKYYSIEELHRILFNIEKQLNGIRQKLYRGKLYSRQRMYVQRAENDTYRKYVAIKTFLQTGMRMGELRGLKWSVVDTSNLIITISHQLTQQNIYTHTKNNTIREVPITIELASDFDRLRQIYPDAEYIFDFTSDTINDFIRKIEKSENIPCGKNVSHRFRHSIATYLDGLKASRYCLEHADKTFEIKEDVHTKYYVHNKTEDFRKYADAVYQYYVAVLKCDRFEYAKNAQTEMQGLISSGGVISGKRDIESMGQNLREEFMMIPRRERGSMTLDQYKQNKIISVLKQYAAEKENVITVLSNKRKDVVLKEIWDNNLFYNAEQYKIVNNFEDFVEDFKNGIIDRAYMEKAYNKYISQKNKPVNLLLCRDELQALFELEEFKERLFT